MDDPFKFFEEQERSWTLLQALNRSLAAKAAEQLRSEPWKSLAGLILERGTHEARRLTTAPAPELAGLGIALADVVDREVVEAILHYNGGEATLKWMKENLESDQLPILFISKNGFRVLGTSLNDSNYDADV